MIQYLLLHILYIRNHAYFNKRGKQGSRLPILSEVYGTTQAQRHTHIYEQF